MLQGYKISPRDKLPSNDTSTSVEDNWNNFKDIIFERMERFVPHKMLKQNPESEYYNKEVKRLEAKARRAYNRRKLAECCQELKSLSSKLLVEKRRAHS
jgi:pyoverdine/dityrosine biosynthesis protein Dit1